jgi:tetratricopeptide (TPR) repeat protein
MIELYRSENLVVRSIAGSNSDRWVVTFDNFGIGHGFDRQGFGESFFQSRDVSAIHVMGKSEDWYQYADIEQALATVRTAVADASRVMTYGSSMGGYAAIRFADAAAAHAVLALSPQYTIDPAKPPFDDRWSQHGHAINWRPEIDGPVRCSVRPVLVYDPKTADGQHARRYAHDIDIVEMALPHTAHPVTTFLSEVGVLESLIFGVLDGTADIEGIRTKAWAGRRTSIAYLNELTRVQPPHRERSALRLARLACAENPGNAAALEALAERLSLSGQHAEALLTYEQALACGERLPTLLANYVNGLVAAGEVSKGRDIAREVMEALPHMAYLWGWYANLCWTDGSPSEARRAIAKAMALDPSNPAFVEQRRLYHTPLDPPSDPTPWLIKGRRWARHRYLSLAERRAAKRLEKPIRS